MTLQSMELLHTDKWEQLWSTTCSSVHEGSVSDRRAHKGCVLASSWSCHLEARFPLAGCPEHRHQQCRPLHHSLEILHVAIVPHLRAHVLTPVVVLCTGSWFIRNEFGCRALCHVGIVSLHGDCRHALLLLHQLISPPASAYCIYILLTGPCAVGPCRFVSSALPTA